MPPNRHEDVKSSPSFSGGRFEVYDGVAGWICGDVLLLLWQRPAREARVRQVSGWVASMLADGTADGPEHGPQTFAACQFLLPSASPPDRGGRAAAKEGLRRFGPRTRRLITTPLGGGLWKRLVRTIIRVAVRLFGHGALVKVASSEAQAFAMLAQVATERTPDRHHLAAALADLYRALDLDPPSTLTPTPGVEGTGDQ